MGRKRLSQLAAQSGFELGCAASAQPWSGWAVPIFSISFSSRSLRQPREWCFARLFIPRLQLSVLKCIHGLFPSMPGVYNLWGREANRCLRDSRFGKSWKSWSHKTQDPMQAQSRGRQVPRPVPAHLQAVPPANHRSPGPTPGSARGIDAPGQSPFLSSVSAAQAARCHRPPQSLGGNEGSSRGRGAGSRPQTRGFSTERAR